jgi:hypothetical protein
LRYSDCQWAGQRAFNAIQQQLCGPKVSTPGKFYQPVRNFVSPLLRECTLQG